MTPQHLSGSRSIPLRRPPLAHAASETTPVGSAADVATTTTVTPGTPLTGALGDQDNITSGPGALTPPDMGFAVSGTYEIELINVVGRIWTGTTPGPVFSLAAFFSPTALGDELSDPWVLYDAGSQRFFAGIFDVTLGGEIMSVSQTSDPTGSWFVYRIQYPSTTVTSGGCPDQGKGGLDSNVVALGFNEFSDVQCGGGGSYLGAALEVFNKSQMMSGATLNFTYTDPLGSYISLVPADSLTTTETTERFASLDYGTGTLLHQITSTGIPGVSTVSLTVQPDLTVKTYSAPPKAAQPGTTVKVNTGDDRTQEVATKGTKMLVTQTIGCRPLSDTAKRSCSRVYEVNNGTSIAKSLTISAIGAYDFYPAATFAGTSVGVSFGSSSSTVFPSLEAMAGAWGQAFAAPVVVASGTAKNTSTRYGDYFAASPQPGSTTDFWAAGEIGGTSGVAPDKWNTAAGPVTVS